MGSQAEAGTAHNRQSTTQSHAWSIEPRNDEASQMLQEPPSPEPLALGVTKPKSGRELESGTAEAAACPSSF